MNSRSLLLLGYTLVFFLGGYWIFHLTTLSQFILVLLGYVGLAAGCLWWWTVHAYSEDPGTERDAASPVANRTEDVVSAAAPRRIQHVTRPTES